MARVTFLIWCLFAVFQAGSSADSGCGGPRELTAGSGTFSSANYPSPYPVNLTCEWLISAGPGKVTMLQFTTMDVEGGFRPNECPYDSVKVYDGGDASGPPRGQYCATNIPPPDLVFFGDAFVVFTSDERNTRPGFSACYSTSTPPALPTPCGNVGTQAPTPPPLRPVTAWVESGCGGPRDLSGPSGSFSSLQHPANYPHSHHCEWLITVDPGMVVTLTFDVFDVEHHDTCSRDSVLVYDGPSTSAGLIGEYCGNVPPRRIVSSGEQLYVIFNTDDENASTGFSASFLAADPSQVTDLPTTTSKIHVTTTGGSHVTKTTSQRPIADPTTEGNNPAGGASSSFQATHIAWMVVMRVVLMFLQSI
ncbi:PREDICTED: bone morphogenetic protein 1-like isoform X1 [Branchiostoma belcheri]|uniref:Bone morphogenetic protein 1-like isoform X1 n=2 Tax=Branchiostoma belcheri TaxID=7741 RepID=A0A6P4ZQV6_BRABE|nr:PREDICTED: bone morphogenetic protein 1-like isoform X1 [Branchiostoma belcheri]